MTSWSSRSVAFLVVTIMLINSHSYWVRINSRDHSVASDELSLARSRMSLAAVRSGDAVFTSDIMTAAVAGSFSALTSVYEGHEGQVAPLRVEGEFEDVHPAGADQHLVVPEFHVTQVIDGQIRTRGSFVLLCPVQERRGDALMSQKTVFSHLPPTFC